MSELIPMETVDELEQTLLLACEMLERPAVYSANQRRSAAAFLREVTAEIISQSREAVEKGIER